MSGVVDAYLAGINAADVDAVLATVTDDFVNVHTAALGQTVTGAAAYRIRLPEFLGRFPGLRYEVEDRIAAGDRVVVQYRMHGGWRAAEGDVRPFALRGVFIFRIADGRIASRVDYWDGLEFERQVGLRGL